MSGLFTGLLAKTPISSSFKEPAPVELPISSEEPLAAGAGKELALDEPHIAKCELKIEGMTCGACVEVCFAVSYCTDNGH
jgi:P-type Cu+ transporter